MADDVRETLDHFIDKAGARVEVGDYIVYGHALGRCAGLRFGRVLKIEQVTNWRSNNEWRIQVQGVDDDWDHKTTELCKSKGTLQFPSRTIKANAFVPDYVRKLCEV
jgi:hypothetical protein